MSSDTDWVNNNAVNILTVHSSTGLEFPVVFLINLVSQRFPSLERREKIPLSDDLIKETLPEGDYHLEEERRLFYVGMTRARDLLYFSASNFYGEGKREKKISPFVYEVLGEVEFKTNEKVDPQLPLFSWDKKEEIQIPVSRTQVNFLSYSQIQTFEMCPLHYKLRYILKIPTPASSALSFGITIHDTLRDFYQSARAGIKTDEEFMLSLYEKNWINEGYLSKHHAKQTREKGIKYLRDYFKKSYNSKSLPLAIETPFIFPVANNLKFGGKIDRIDKLENGKIEIIDYKTSNKVPTQKDVNRDMQMTFYALAATKVRDPLLWKKPQAVVLSLYYFEDQIKISTTRTKEQLEEAKTKVIEVAKKIETSNFKCSGSNLCANCEYKLYCEVK
ncbi:ATP-dependent helicase [Candidatus Gottesmanbacteria bacterium]|nr:ATP-dependent helicase [Candidatus Gottesmanbacteria bacterium]